MPYARRLPYRRLPPGAAQGRRRRPKYTGPPCPRNAGGEPDPFCPGGRSAHVRRPGIAAVVLPPEAVTRGPGSRGGTFRTTPRARPGRVALAALCGRREVGQAADPWDGTRAGLYTDGHATSLRRALEPADPGHPRSCLGGDDPLARPRRGKRDFASGPSATRTALEPGRRPRAALRRGGRGHARGKARGSGLAARRPGAARRVAPGADQGGRDARAEVAPLAVDGGTFSGARVSSKAGEGHVVLLGHPAPCDTAEPRAVSRASANDVGPRTIGTPLPVSIRLPSQYAISRA